MQFTHPSHPGSDSIPSDAGLPARPGFAAAEPDAVLDLVQGCVEAMSMLQAKFTALEVETKIKLDAAQRELLDARAALAGARIDIEANAQRLGDGEARIAQLETSAAQTARHTAESIAAAREEAATWRMRVETDSMGFEHLTARITTIEEGLSHQLATATRKIADHEAENARLRIFAEATQSHSSRLQARLRDVDATIADQRSRISCLQSKLATASYAIRMEHLSRNSDVPPFASEHDILDLQPTGSSLVSAA